MPSTTPPPPLLSTFADRAETAAKEIGAFMPATPLQRNDYLSERTGAEVLLKREDLSPVRSYKLRGAYNFFRKALAEPSPPTRFICASAGNHAQGFAYACRHFGVEGAVFMPVTTPAQKIQKTKAFGGDRIAIELVGDSFDQSNAAAIAHAAEVGARFAPPFDDADVIEGQATVGVEILAAATRPIDLLILPVGGGGLSAGVIQVFQARSPATRIVLVEPVGAPSLSASLDEGRRVKLERVDGFVDGAAVAEIGALNWEVLRRTRREDVVLAPEDRVCITILDMLNVEGVVLEPAGALEIDAMLHLPAEALRGKTVCCVTSGGNFDFERLPDVKERALKAAVLKKYYLLRLPQRPGALRDFLNILGPDDDIARFEYLKKTARNFGSILIGIETQRPENFETLETAMRAAGYDHRDITRDDVVASFIL